MFGCLVERYKMTSIAHKHWSSITAARRSHPDAVCFAFPLRSPRPRALSQATHFSVVPRVPVCQTSSPPSTDVDPLTTCACLTWRPLQAQTARASGLSAAAVPRDVLRGRATSTCVSDHSTQPRGATLGLWMAIKDNYTVYLASWLKMLEKDHESLGCELRVPEYDADTAQSRPGSCCSPSSHDKMCNRPVFGQAASKNG